MFGNQQNRQVLTNAAASAGESFTSNAEKRELLVLKDTMLRYILANTTRIISGIHLRMQEPLLPRDWVA